MLLAICGRIPLENSQKKIEGIEIVLSFYRLSFIVLSFFVLSFCRFIVLSWSSSSSVTHLSNFIFTGPILQPCQWSTEKKKTLPPRLMLEQDLRCQVAKGFISRPVRCQAGTWRIIPGIVSSDRMGPPFISHEVSERPFGVGVPCGTRCLRGRNDHESPWAN